LFCGIGGGAIGFNRGEARVGSTRAKSVCIGGIDVDAASCRDFETNVGVKATCLDLFTLEQYVAFHGRMPPAGWTEAVPGAIIRAFGGRRPNTAFLSAPCKGFSGLLSESSSKLDKYQALNGLTLRGVWLLLEAYKDDPVELIVFENVPRIATRGRYLLDQIIALLRSYGYAVAETTHDCGELGGLGQSRKRFLLVARHEAKVPAFLYEPPKHPLRGVGEILEQLPMPLSGEGGAMHRMPALQWKTWVRLAFVRAGGDWRSLNELEVEDGVLRDYGIMPTTAWHRGVYGVRKWDEPSGAVTSRSTPTCGTFAVADPREIRTSDFHGLRVNEWDQTAAAITTQRSPGSSAQSVADPRVDGHPRSVQLGVRPWDKPSGVITGQMAAGQGPNAVADPRPGYKPGTHQNHFRIISWSSPSGAITGSDHITGGAPAVADVRFNNWHPGASSSKLRVTPWDGVARPVTGSQQVGSGAGAVADPRTGYGDDTRKNVMRVTDWEDPAGTVTSGHSPSNGAGSFADPRTESFKGAHGVLDWGEPAGAIPGESLPSNGKFAVADPRAPDGGHGGKYRVTRMEEPAGTVIAASTTGNGAFSVADPRPVFTNGGREVYQSAGHYGVVDWNDPSRAVFGHGSHDNGFNSVADPRADESAESGEIVLPAPADRLVCVILARDETWHRPFTTLELAALQGLVDPSEKFELDGLSDSSWRERIGNCVPPPSAQAIANVMFETLLLAWSGTTFTLSSQPIWVRDVAVALSLKPQEMPSW
jgi:site-specific DNA-cytosine methylase